MTTHQGKKAPGPLYGFQWDESGPGERQVLPGPGSAWPIQPLRTLPAGPLHYAVHDSPAGPMLVVALGESLAELHLPGSAVEEAVQDVQQRFNARLLRRSPAATRAWAMAACRLLQAGETSLPGPLYLAGTGFQQRVWQQLLRIPRGWLTTYGCIAEALGQPRAARAIGQAVGHNPLGLFVPCHRVLPAGKGLGHYRWGGESVKHGLLATEEAIPAAQGQSRK